MNVLKNTVQDSKNLISLPGVLDGELAKVFTNEVQAWLLLPVEEHVLQCNSVTKIENNFYPCLASFAKILKQNKKRLTSSQMNAKLKNQLRADGMYGIFSPEPESPAKPEATKIDVRIVNPILAATIFVFQAQVGYKAQPGRPFIPQGNEGEEFALVGLISLDCSEFQGHIALCFTADVFLKIYEKMVGEKPTAITNEIVDGASELLNVIYGTAKTTLNKELGLNLKPALPMVLQGEKIKVRRPPEGQVLVLPFTSDAGTFHVEIFQSPNPRGKRAAS